MIKRSIIILFVVALMVGIFVPTVGAFAMAETPSVLDELKADSSFDASAYPEKEGDYTLDIFQLVEVGDGAVIYVYQPWYKDPAVKISMSIAAGDEPKPKQYPLQYLGNSGTLYKYKILEYTKPKTNTRYYNIYSIYRNYIADVDGAPEGDNTTNLKALEVGQSIVATTNADGKVMYDYKRLQVVVITDMFVGKIRYARRPAGFENIFRFHEDVDSHFVGFNTDWPITDLLEVELTFVTADYTYDQTNLIDDLINPPRHKFQSASRHTAVLSKGEKIRDPAVYPARCEYDYYLRERIARSIDFVQDDALSKENAKELAKYSWVVRFYESAFEVTYSPSSPPGYTARHESYTNVYKVSILRLKFEVFGKVYNLGAVSDEVTGSNYPINPPKRPGLPRWLEILIAIIIGLLVLAVLGPVLPYIFKFVIWVILLPFRAVAAIVKAIKRRREN